MGRLQFFVDALVTLLHDGETGFLGVCYGNGGKNFGDVDFADFFTHRIFAVQAVCERGTVDRPHQFKTIAAKTAGFCRILRVLRDVLVNRHRQARAIRRIARAIKIVKFKPWLTSWTW